MKPIQSGLLLLMLVSPLTHADLYLELGLEQGGDVLVETNDGDQLRSGGGIKFALGVENPVGRYGENALRFALGYLYDPLTARNGYSEIDTLTFDMLYTVGIGHHRIAFGPTLHLSPRYRDDVDGFRPLDIEFDDAAGIMVEYGYRLGPSLKIGARWTDIEYRNATTRLDAGGVGVYLSNGF